ncbi:hypothetical protein CCUG63695_03581 [Mycobacteroides franklinii]|uniref:Uncharacterized protein n=1 Tax=Mycobacteroides franklinii TaxID=948102 RepID=A0A4R8R3K2_9MYCO|nr:hypothetical protein CCUG64054_03654 [Mycobacteroides franklinii]TDZ50731.1 hypothetical protein CCUG63697_02240 [Mycobacteroides franklinii]TDZ57151.1 hypothetical protein CCUG63696_03656 [Mycobacteroides franklinii]TDZ64092.1 hypothetical protein CCUG63695_03581 [Mycobacteroides franklinii]TDZ70489.1 hypothetical protein CCUG64056_03654 [Mycobacteroides franklinii]
MPPWLPSLPPRYPYDESNPADSPLPVRQLPRRCRAALAPAAAAQGRRHAPASESKRPAACPGSRSCQHPQASLPGHRHAGQPHLAHCRLRVGCRPRRTAACAHLLSRRPVGRHVQHGMPCQYRDRTHRLMSRNPTSGPHRTIGWRNHLRHRLNCCHPYRRGSFHCRHQNWLPAVCDPAPLSAFQGDRRS